MSFRLFGSKNEYFKASKIACICRDYFRKVGLFVVDWNNNEGRFKISGRIKREVGISCFSLLVLQSFLYNRRNKLTGAGSIMGREDIFFKRKKLNREKLLAYGFEKNAELYTYKTTIMKGEFQLMISISNGGLIDTKLIEFASDEVYVLHRTSAAGSFVGSVKTEYDEVLQDIADKCFETDVFKSEMTKKVIQYVQATYQDELEFLWPKTPSNAIFRRKETKKWYAALLTIQKNKLGLPSDEVIEVIDLRNKPEKVSALVDALNYFPGYHMNKKYWLTICLDGSVSFEAIKELIDESFQLAVK